MRAAEVVTTPAQGLRQLTIFDTPPSAPTFQWKPHELYDTPDETYLIAHVDGVRLYLMTLGPHSWSNSGWWQAYLDHRRTCPNVVIRGPERAWVESVLAEALQEWKIDPWPGTFTLDYPAPWRVHPQLDALRRRPTPCDA